LDHFDRVKGFLDDLNLEYAVNSNMVRGLDYYTKTAFEVKSGKLGAQNSLAGGGRYDGLVALLGGPDVAGVGFGIGMERLLACLPDTEENVGKTDIFVAALGTRALKFAFKLTGLLRRSGFTAATDYSGKSLKSQMKRADKMQSAFTLIIGDSEMDSGRAVLRNMKTKNQQDLLLESLPEALINILKSEVIL